MPGTMMATGTTYYGARDRAIDESFITTEWFVIFNVPILPLRSYRVVYLSDSDAYEYGYHIKSENYITHRVPLDWIQVLSTWAIYLATVVASAVLVFGVAVLVPGVSQCELTWVLFMIFPATIVLGPKLLFRPRF